MSTRYVGTCPVCNARFKVRRGVLVHHGYRRPGYGHIVGDCFAVHMEPHETSPRTAEKYREHAKAQIESLEAERARLGSVVELIYTYKVYDGVGQSSDQTVVIRAGDEPYYAGPYSVPGFKALQRQCMGMLAQQIEWFQAAVQRMSGLIAVWSAQPLTTQEEETARLTREARDARAATQAARQAAKAAQAARKAERAARAGEKLKPLLERAWVILDKVAAADVRAVRAAYLQVLQIKVPISLQDRFFDSLGRDQLLRDAGLFLPHNAQRLIRHPYLVRQLFLEEG